MNIFILTAGSRGDVQPYVALGKGLKTAGRTVMESASDVFGLLKTMVSMLKQARAITRDMLRDAWIAVQAARPDLVIFY